MATAIFGIDNGGLNLVVNLLVLMLVVVWLALIVYTYLDAKRRVSDSFLVGCATIGSFIPYVGTAVYAIVRPPEFLEDARERALEIEAAELRVRQLRELSCPGCEYPIERAYLRCPSCQRHLKDPCPNCRKPVDPSWSLCPYCEKALPGRSRQERPAEARRSRREERPAQREERPQRERSGQRGEKPAPRGEKPAQRGEKPAQREDRSTSKREASGKSAPASTMRKDSARSSASKGPPSPKKPQRSPNREPDPDPRQA
jgi:hypothetical protein